jgi:O-antigen polysaccharide polymerase Wzy
MSLHRPQVGHLSLQSIINLPFAVLWLGVVVSGGLIAWGEEPSLWILGLGVLTGVLFALGRFSLLHPYTWYCPLFFLYSISVPILVWLGVRQDLESVKHAVSMEWLALATFSLVIGPQIRTFTCPDRGFAFDLKTTAWITLLASCAVSGLYLDHIWRNDLSSKYAIALSDSVFTRLDSSFSIYALAFSVLLAASLKKGVFPGWLVLFSLGWNTFAFLICGERDFVFRILWISLFLVDSLYRPLPRWGLAGFAIGAIALVPILQDMKNLLLLSDGPPVVAPETSMISRVLLDEFLTGSENLQTYLQERSDGPFFFGETLLWDIKRAVLPGAIFPTERYPTRWFNETFYPDVLALGGGRGFTLVGEGYMNFGAVGVILWFLLLGCFVKYLYVRATESLAWLAVYVVSMPLIVFIIRADFSHLISQFGKHILLPMVLLYTGQHVLMWSRLKPLSSPTSQTSG